MSFVCKGCGSTETRDTIIHDGASLRRDCAVCDRFVSFPIWYWAPSVEATREIVAARESRVVESFLAPRRARIRVQLSSGEQLLARDFAIEFAKRQADKPSDRGDNWAHGLLKFAIERDGREFVSRRQASPYIGKLGEIAVSRVVNDHFGERVCAPDFRVLAGRFDGGYDLTVLSRWRLEVKTAARLSRENMIRTLDERARETTIVASFFVGCGWTIDDPETVVVRGWNYVENFRDLQPFKSKRNGNTMYAIPFALLAPLDDLLDLLMYEQLKLDKENQR
jgi:hypothetical protein